MYDQIAQATTLPTATRRGTHWTQRELNTLRDLLAKGNPDRITAIELNRSLYGVRSTKRNLTERMARTTRLYRPTLPYDRGFTSLADMGF